MLPLLLMPPVGTLFKASSIRMDYFSACCRTENIEFCNIALPEAVMNGL